MNLLKRCSSKHQPMVSGVETCAIFRIFTGNYKYYLVVHIAINFLRLHLQYAEPSESTVQRGNDCDVRCLYLLI